MEHTRIPEAVDDSWLDLLSISSDPPPPPLPGQSEPWMLMAVPEVRALPQELPSQNIYPDLSLSTFAGTHQSSHNSGTARTRSSSALQRYVPQPIISQLVMNTQPPVPSLDSLMIGSRAAKGRGVLDIEEIKKLSLSDQQDLIQNPKVTKLDLQDQIKLHIALVEKLNAEYRLKIEEFRRSLRSKSEENESGDLVDFKQNDEIKPVEDLLSGFEDFEQKPVPKKRYSRPTETVRFCCTIENCDKTFVRNRDRERHERTVHVHGGTGPTRGTRKRYTCLEPSCKRNEEFSRRDNAKAHVARVHNISRLDAANHIGERWIDEEKLLSKQQRTIGLQESSENQTHEVGFSFYTGFQPEFPNLSDGLHTENFDGSWESDISEELSSQEPHQKMNASSASVSSGGLQCAKPRSPRAPQIHQGQSDIVLLGNKKSVPLIRKGSADGLANMINGTTALHSQMPKENSGVILIGYEKPVVQGA
ncbi:hypothetical protein TWF506_000233 [Arthrobotrys conoides]|uniref:C2H2-type domain-containing protein n=1 Tax=Arthrobotrys conoides TaxID=74498 RepID=A0AAN8NDH2_9PEZI